MRYLLLLSILLLAAPLVSCFGVNKISKSGLTFTYRSRSWRAAGRDDEIAELEDRLRRLKQEASLQETSIQEMAAQEAVKAPTTPTPTDSKNTTTTTTTTTAVDKTALERIEGRSFVLSEADLLQADIMGELDSDANVLVSFFAMGALILFLFFFAQIPIGQEGLSQYSATGSSAVQTIDLGDLNRDVPKK
jgi:hypothetical protein